MLEKSPCRTRAPIVSGRSGYDPTGVFVASWLLRKSAKVHEHSKRALEVFPAVSAVSALNVVFIRRGEPRS